uniref:DUF4219 domain-containing protein n=1 Tax=Talaromyces marneffei PM1 TaxID=1077442 RepID=A0A093UL86_TALMA
MSGDRASGQEDQQQDAIPDYPGPENVRITTFEIEKAGRSNIKNWKLRMQIFLETQDCWDVVELTEKYQKDPEKVQALFRRKGNIKQDDISTVRDCKLSGEMWAYIRKKSTTEDSDGERAARVEMVSPDEQALVARSNGKRDVRIEESLEHALVAKQVLVEKSDGQQAVRIRQESLEQALVARSNGKRDVRIEESLEHALVAKQVLVEKSDGQQAVRLGKNPWNRP